MYDFVKEIFINRKIYPQNKEDNLSNTIYLSKKGRTKTRTLGKREHGKAHEIYMIHIDIYSIISLEKEPRIGVRRIEKKRKIPAHRTTYTAHTQNENI